MTEPRGRESDSKHAYTILLISGVMILIAAGIHFFWGTEWRERAEVTMSQEIVDTGMRKEVVETLMNASMDNLLKVYASETKLIQDTFPNHALLPTLSDVRREMVKLYSVEEETVMREFIVGGYFFARGEMRQAARHYNLANDHMELPSAYLMQALALRIAGEEVKSYYASLKAQELAAKAGNQKVIDGVDKLLSRFVAKAQRMIITALLISSIVSIIICIALIKIYKNIQAAKAGRGTIPLPYRHSLITRISEAMGQELEALELEIDQIREQGAYKIAGNGSGAIADFNIRKLTDIRNELNKVSGNGNGHSPPELSEKILHAEREFLIGSFLGVIRDHSKAIQHFNAAIEKVDIPTFHYLLGASLLAKKNKKGAGRAFRKAMELAGMINDAEMETMIKKRVEAL